VVWGHFLLCRRIIRHFHEPMPEMADASAALSDLCQSGFERDLFGVLTERGYRVIPQVGSEGFSIDMVVGSFPRKGEREQPLKTALALRNRRNDRIHYRSTNDGGSGAPANQHRQTITIQATASVVIQHLRQKRLSRQAERGCRLV
jgi:hypothetical protein